jgi:hypothetical protein
MTDDQPNIPTPPVIPEGSDTKKPIWKRWWFWVGALVLVGIIGSMGGDGGEVPPVAGGSTTTTEALESTTTEAPTTTSTTTTTTAPTTTTTLPAWQAFTVEGSGDDFIELAVPDGDAAVLAITHNGSSNFGVVTYTAANDRLDLLVNEIGDYEGRVPVNFLLGQEVGLIEITADGPWTITALPLSDLELGVDTAAGQGDDVLLMTVTAPTLDVTHDGDSNFVVSAWTDDRDLLINEIGPYQGTVRTPTGTVIYEINADGNWTLSAG